uniref:Transmembrane protein 138 n=1 Tax=Panagrellus redivivus TaxID=6233 RepID=A0A7E4ZVM0_PANRE
MWHVALPSLPYIPPDPRYRERPQDYACFGRIHLKGGIALCLIFAFFADVLQLIITLKHNVSFLGLTDYEALFIDFLELICVMMVACSLLFSDQRFLLVAMPLKFFLVLGWTINTLIFLTALWWPESSAGQYAFPMDSTWSSVARFIIFVHMALFETWFLSLILALYVYYEHKQSGLLLAPRFQLSQHEDVEVRDNNEHESGFANPNFEPTTTATHANDSSDEGDL